MTSLEYFRLFAPAFVSLTDGVANVWITVAGNLANVEGLPAETANMALALYAAHLYSLTLNQGAGSSSARGAVLREKEGDLEREYAQVKGDTTWLGSSTYGLQFMQVTRAIAGSAIMTRVKA